MDLKNILGGTKGLIFLLLIFFLLMWELIK